MWICAVKLRLAFCTLLEQLCARADGQDMIE